VYESKISNFSCIQNRTLTSQRSVWSVFRQLCDKQCVSWSLTAYVQWTDLQLRRETTVNQLVTCSKSLNTLMAVV